MSETFGRLEHVHQITDLWTRSFTLLFLILSDSIATGAYFKANIRGDMSVMDVKSCGEYSLLRTAKI